MKKYKRLTNNNLDEYNPEYDFCVGCKYFGEPNGCNRPNGTCGNYERFIETYNSLAELEDKLENGTLIDLPCKLGDEVYRIRKKPYPIVLERFVVNITLCFNHKGEYEWRIFTTTEDTLGKTVFLTKAEAEEKLRELGEV